MAFLYLPCYDFFRDHDNITAERMNVMINAMPKGFPEGFLWGGATAANQVEGGGYSDF